MTEKTPQWYLAIVLYESSSPDPNYKPLYEECISLIEADSDAHARQKVEKLAIDSQTSYQNQFGQTLHQTIKHIIDVAPLVDEKLQDGATLYARFFRNYQAYHDMEPLLSGEEL